ncbi:MAG: hypothetical protein IE909_00855 [Campylobacterales bacterium]|nr:hypothetical protein [Campylobacterales bacterium]
MNKKLVFFLSLLFLFIAYFLGFDRYISNQISKLNTVVNSFYLNTILTLESIIDRYIFQINYIEQLKNENEKNELYKIKYDTIQTLFHEINQSNSLVYQTDLNLSKTQVLRFKSIYDNSTVILDHLYDANKTIQAMVSLDGYSAGIAFHKDDQVIGLFNNNPKCNYTVYIGNDKATGITSGFNNVGELIVKFVPNWQNVHLSDEVITSGMDAIFPLGIKVGKVVEIIESENTKTLYVAPYAYTYKSRFFYIF